MNIIQKSEIIEFDITEPEPLKRLSELFKGKNVVRFAISEFDKNTITCEYAYADNNEFEIKNIFEFNKRKSINYDKFNVVMICPTGINLENGGDVDNNSTAKLVASVCDNLITHANVWNACEINEMTANTLYLEGSTLTQFVLGTVGLKKSKNNKILLLVDNIEDKNVLNSSINCASTARMCLGSYIDVMIISDFPEYNAFYNEKNIAVGEIKNIEKIVNIINENKNKYDSFALHTTVKMQPDVWDNYFNNIIDVNPVGGFEASLTHSLSNICSVPIVHAPLNTNLSDFAYPYNIVNPEKAPETVAKLELYCILKGMHFTPKISDINDNKSFTNTDISCLTTPDRCLGIPHLYCLENNIPIIVIDDNTNIMKNDLSLLPWNKYQFFRAKNYLEAVGILTCLKEGIAVDTVKRPVGYTIVNLN